MISSLENKVALKPPGLRVKCIAECQRLPGCLSTSVSINEQDTSCILHYHMTEMNNTAMSYVITDPEWDYCQMKTL